MVSRAGAVVLVETVRRLGLDGALSTTLGPWRRPMALHDPGKVVLDLAIAIALGGDRLADVALLLSEPGLFGRNATCRDTSNVFYDPGPVAAVRRGPSARRPPA